MTRKFGFAARMLTSVALLAIGALIPIGAGWIDYPLPSQSPRAGFKSELPGAIARSLDAKLADVVTVADFGAAPAANDNTAAINRAAQALSSDGTAGGCLRFSAGTFKIAGTISLPSGVGICGDLRSKTDNGAIGTLLLGTGASGQVLLQIGTGSDNPNFNYVQDIAIGFSRPQTAGAAIVVRNAHTVSLQRIFIGINNYLGLRLEGGNGQYNYLLEDIEIGAGWRGIWAGPAMSGKPALVQNITMKNVKIAAQRDACIYLQHVSGLETGVGVECLNSERGLVVQPGVGEIVKSVISSSLVLDANKQENLLIAPTGAGCDPYVSGKAPPCGLVGQVQLVNLWAASSERGPGIRIDTTGGGVVDGLNLVGVTSGNNFASGIETKGPNLSNLFITAPLIGYNNVGGGASSGINFGEGSKYFSVVGGCVGACGKFYPGLVNKQKYGVSVGRGSSHYSIMGVVASGNAKGGLEGAQDGAGSAVSGIVGD